LEKALIPEGLFISLDYNQSIFIFTFFISVLSSKFLWLFPFPKVRLMNHFDKKYKRAIVRTPGKSIINGITSADFGIPDHEKAKRQHEAYIAALQKCGLDVTVLDPLEEYPDSVFIEDTALLTRDCAIITNPGALSRRGETRSMRSVLSAFFRNIEIVKDPGTVDAGDILNVETHYYIGLSARTNQNGAQQVIGFLVRYGLTGSTIPVQNLLHLKSGISYLGNNTIMAAGELQNAPQFQKYDIIRVADEESYVANCIRINDCLLVAAGYSNTIRKIKELGYRVIELDVSEFQKLDGGLSCLSLRF
jgi:dimethylargininase